MSKKYVDLHTHRDQFDADNPYYAFCKRQHDLGAKGFALTSHGVLSEIEPMREAAQEFGLKFIPGIETYYGNDDDLVNNEHLILLSVNYDGYRAIWQAVSDSRSQNTQGRSVMNREILADYFGEGTSGHGNVIATSACINGVIAAKLRTNEVLQREIDKANTRMAKYAPYEQQAENAAEKIAGLQKELDVKNEELNTLQNLAKMKFVAREKSVAKMQGTPEYESAKKALDADMLAAQNATAKLPDAKKEVAALKTRISAFNKEYKAAQEKASRGNSYKEKIAEYTSKLTSFDVMRANAVAETKEMVSIFGDGNFYMEVQNHGIDKEKEIYPVLVEIAKELHVPIVATNDVHTIDNSEDELLKRQILRSMRFEQWEEQMVGDDQLYIKTDEELEEWLLKILDKDIVEEALNNTIVIFDRCNVEFETENHYPVFPSKDGKSGNAMLLDAIREGVKWRFPNGISKEYKARINYEYKIIRDMGYADYHLIVKDFLEYGRVLGPVPDEFIDEAPLDIQEAKAWVEEHGWKGGFTIGPGRGSAAGSLVCYVLGITSLDPLKYDLLFERFLNPERVSMPDIDSDLANRIRPKVIEYVRHKYGQDAVCGIMTTNAQAPRGAIRIAAKYYALSKKMDGEFLSLGDEMAKKIPNEPGISFDSDVNGMTVETMLTNEYSQNADALNIIKWAKLIEGCFTAYGAHAAGVVISDGAPVSNYVPLRWNNKLQEMTTQVDMNRVESKGLIKMDFLGLRTLDILTDTIRMVMNKTGKVIDPLTDITIDDADVYREIFAKARTNSVFQFESDGMKNMLKRFKPDSFEDLIILVSMFRPGPLQYLDGVIDVKNGKKEMSFLCPELEPILGKTYGAIVYQEQVMEIFQKLAGYTLGGADQVRRFMSKKKMDKLVHEKEAFIHGDASRNINGCVANGISEKVANELFEQMTDFAKYAFNKSHAAAYAFNSYITAWFKHYYPSEFLAAALKWAKQDKIEGLMKEAASFGITVLVPDVNRSMSDFTVTDDDNIRFGLSAVKAVGSNADEIIRVRTESGAFVSLEDFFTRANVNKKAIENLMWAGAFDNFGENREAMISTIDIYKDTISKRDAKAAVLEDMKKIIPFIADVESAEELAQLRQALDVSEASVPNMTTTDKLQKRIDNAEKSLETLVADVQNIVVPSMEENTKLKMAKEKELLGVYVTGHPLDDYDSAPDYGAHTISDAEDEKHQKNITKTAIIGVVNNVKKGVSKKKTSYAILDVEDKTGSIKVCLFSDTYQKYKDIQEGDVFKFSGNINEEKYVSDDDEERLSYSIICNKVEPLIKKKKAIFIQMRSYQEYKDSEQRYRRWLEDVNGRKAQIYFADIDRIMKLPYRIRENVLKESWATEI